jgi:AMMECR1 domain-containing protein
MASPKARVVDHGLCVPLARPLTGAQRTALTTHVRKLLAWQRSLARWPAPGVAPDATPFVSIYAGGALRGCFGSHEGSPGERLTRAFLRSLEDARYGLVRPEERDRIVAVVSYVRSIRPLDTERAHEQIAVGTDGVGMTKPGVSPAVLLPSVARDQKAGPRDMLAILAKKSGVADWREAKLFAVTTDEVVVRSGERAARPLPPGRRDQAAAWLARLVGDDGSVTYAIDARGRRLLASGLMHHGRAASVVRALAGHPRYDGAARRASKWLAVSIEAGLQGKAVQGWPADPAMVAGTIALAHMAGVPMDRPLRHAAEGEDLRRSPWHAGQVAAALGRDAPESLWRTCVEHLGAHPWAPWTLLAARARADAEVTERTARAVIESLRENAPHAGGCRVAEVPETAVTALAIEALDGLEEPAARRAVERGRSFLRERQLVAPAIPAELDPELASGAFAASPVVVDLLRCDVAGHAFSALGRNRARWQGRHS